MSSSKLHYPHTLLYEGCRSQPRETRSYISTCTRESGYKEVSCDQTCNSLWRAFQATSLEKTAPYSGKIPQRSSARDDTERGHSKTTEQFQKMNSKNSFGDEGRRHLGTHSPNPKNQHTNRREQKSRPQSRHKIEEHSTSTDTTDLRVSLRPRTLKGRCQSSLIPRLRELLRPPRR